MKELVKRIDTTPNKRIGSDITLNLPFNVVILVTIVTSHEHIPCQTKNPDVHEKLIRLTMARRVKA